MRDRRRLVETLKASHTDIKKPAMSEARKRADIFGIYPSWNAVKSVISPSKAINKRFCVLALLVPLVMAYLQSYRKFFSNLASGELKAQHDGANEEVCTDC